MSRRWLVRLTSVPLAAAAMTIWCAPALALEPKPLAASYAPHLALSGSAADARRPPRPDLLAQMAPFGTRCSSNVGICPTVPAPLGSLCQCGPYPGYVIP